MKIESINLPKVERFACSKADIKEVFSESLLNSVSFGRYSKTFKFEGASETRPVLTGKVVANLTVTTLRSSHLSLYPIRRDDYKDEAVLDFKENILPQMKVWLDSICQSSATLKRLSFIVEWSADEHCIHKGNYY